jgi:hypothetical protein
MIPLLIHESRVVQEHPFWGVPQVTVLICSIVSADISIYPIYWKSKVSKARDVASFDQREDTPEANIFRFHIDAKRYQNGGTKGT